MKTRFERAAECLNAENKLINLDFSDPVKAAKKGRKLQAKVFNVISEA